MNYTTNTLASTGAAVAPLGVFSPWVLFSAVSVVIVAGALRVLTRRQVTRP